MRSTGYALPFRQDAPLWLVGFHQLWLVHFNPRCFGVFLWRSAVIRFSIVVFLDCGHPCFRKFLSSIPVDVVRVKSYVNRLFVPGCVPRRITINKLYFVPKWVVSSVVSVFWNGGGLGTGKSDVSFMFFDSILHRSSSLANVDFSAFTGNPVYYAILFSRLDSVFRSY